MCADNMPIKSTKTQTIWKWSSEVQWSGDVKRAEIAHQQWNPCHMSLMNKHTDIMFMHQAGQTNAY